MKELYRIPVSTLLMIPLLWGLSADLAKVHGQPTKTPAHTHVQTLNNQNLNGLISLVGSKDGKFLYGAAFGSKKLVTMSRDPNTGKVEVVDSIADLNGAVCLAISKDQKWVVLTSCLSSLVTLYSRDAETGKLTEVSRQVQGKDGVNGLGFPIAVTISPDSRFVYVTNDTRLGSLTAFSIENGKLKFLEKHDGLDGCLKGARLLAVDPDGEFLFVPSRHADCLTVFDRNVKTGKLRILDCLSDGEDRRNLLEGVHGLICSKDGRHLYATSGRWSGDQGISVFEILQREVLELVQELEGGKELKNFSGGNFIDISPDGKFVYTTGFKSGNAICLKRDTKSGELEYLYELQANGNANLGPTADIFISNDNRFIYIANEGKQNQLHVFERQMDNAGPAGETKK